MATTLEPAQPMYVTPKQSLCSRRSSPDSHFQCTKEQSSITKPALFGFTCAAPSNPNCYRSRFSDMEPFLSSADASRMLETRRKCVAGTHLSTYDARIVRKALHRC